MWKKDKISRKFKNIRFIGGGTGITPLYHIFIHMLTEDSKNEFKLHFYYGNKTKEDILLKNELDELMKKNDNFQVTHSLSREKIEGY